MEELPIEIEKQELQEMRDESKENDVLDILSPPPGGEGAVPPELTPDTEPPAEYGSVPPVRLQRNGYGWFLAALLPCLALVALGCVLLIARTGAESDSIFSLSAISAPAPAGSWFSGAGEEVRGVYIASVSNINYPSRTGLSAAALRSELDAILDTCAATGLNAVYFQVSPCSDALYASDILPVSAVLTGKEGKGLPGGFDPLKYLCTAAHARGIAVHAWVNPMRVTAKSTAIDSLASDNPARVHSEWTVEYDGAVYYDLGLPEVRALQASVCAELARDYPIDGILFDDYFYPYPVQGKEFDDVRSYADHAENGESLGDFRRRSVTELARVCYQAIKSERAECAFGIAPFGIWQNDDGSNGGSPTRGLESYESIYCDTLAFARGGYVDYVAPQIYWQFTNEVAPYGALCEWWNAALADTQVKLMISHAAYQAGKWDSQSEYTEQIEFARQKRNYVGSIFYGYAAIAADESALRTQLSRAYEQKYAYAEFYSTAEPVTAIIRVDGETLTVKGTSDVGYPLYYGDMPVSQNKDGSFAFTCAKGTDGKIILTQNGQEYIFEVEGE